MPFSVNPGRARLCRQGSYIQLRSRVRRPGDGSSPAITTEEAGVLTPIASVVVAATGKP